LTLSSFRELALNFAPNSPDFKPSNAQHFADSFGDCTLDVSIWKNSARKGAFHNEEEL